MVAWLAFPFFVLRMTYFSGGYDITFCLAIHVLEPAEFRVTEVPRFAQTVRFA